MTTKTKYKVWTLIDWDGNPAMKLKCWRKSFGRGHVSVGVGDFLNIVYSHGANSDDSMSSTRWSYTRIMSEQEAMDMVDRNRGYHNHHDNGSPSPIPPKSEWIHSSKLLKPSQPS